MKPFAYQRPATAEKAVSLAAQPGARYLGGGTNLVDLMKLGVEAPGFLVDVTGLGLDTVTDTPDGVLIGATVRNSDLAADPGIRRRYPVLSQALLAGASGQLRNMATVAGNLLQRTRCMYFQDVTKACNKRLPGSGCPARTGIHHDLAILGASEHCMATHPSDMCVALTALDATVQVVDSRGVRELPITSLFRLPGDDPAKETVLGAGDLIVGVTVPALPMAVNSRYRKARDRASYAFATGSVAAVLDVADDGVVADVRIALGAVAPVPWRARRAEQALIGQPAVARSFQAAADAELEAADALPQNGYKIPLLRNLITSTLTELTEAGRA
jgi:xanthine dehydrogenase YagS FAD-binding subunit